jgi:hypothetical protein
MTVSKFCPGPISRRGFLEIGSTAFAALGLSNMLRLRAEAAASVGADSDTSVIFVWLPGGPPHQETFDLKPEAPLDYRGEFRPIPTTVPGLDICEHMPLLAKVAHKFSIIRSVSHTYADHGGGHKKFLTGRDPNSPVDTVNDHPMIGSVVAKMRDQKHVGLPNYICGTDGGRQNIDVFAFGSAYLPTSTHPFTFWGDPNDSRFEVQNLSVSKTLETRLDDRVSLLGGIDKLRKDTDRFGAMASLDEFNKKALHLLTSNKCRDAFDLSQEPSELRTRYGRHAWGQRAILARRLAEAGASFVTVTMENPLPSGGLPIDSVYNWDSHAVNCHMYNDLRHRLPLFDQAISALVEDIYARGLDKKIMLIVTGEFGRTPRVNTQIGTQTKVMQPGRDHWPQAMSIFVSGGGLKTGVVVGSTNSKGEHPKDRPLEPNDLWATMFRHLNIDTNHAFPDHQGRPMPILTTGAPISELI